MKIGGGNHGIGIHGTHLGPGVMIRYAHSDEARQTIPWVEYSTPDGKTTVYATPDAKPDGAGPDIARDGLHGLPQPALAHASTCRSAPWTRAMNAGPISATLPFAKKKAVEILKAQLPDARGGRAADSRGLREVLPGELSGRLGAAPGRGDGIRPSRCWPSTTATSSRT